MWTGGESKYNHGDSGINVCARLVGFCPHWDAPWMYWGSISHHIYEAKMMSMDMPKFMLSRDFPGSNIENN